MGIRITEHEELYGKDPEHPLVLSAAVDWENMSFSLTYRLRIEGDESLKRVEGLVQGGGGSSKHVIDDLDWDDYYKEAERDSIGSVVDHLKERFPGAKITGVIRSTFSSAYHSPHEYQI